MAKAPNRLWYVVRTNIKCEARASRSLRAAGYFVYRPKMKKDVWHRRKKVMDRREYVLFNRYIFVSVPAVNADWYTLRNCDGVESVLGINGRPFPVHREDVIDFMLAQRSGEFDEITHPNRKAEAEAMYPVGSILKVKDYRSSAHPFAGMHGEVLGVKGKGVVKAMLGIFGSLFPVELRFEDIEPVVDRKRKAA